MATPSGNKPLSVHDNFSDSDRQAGRDQRSGNTCRDMGDDPRQSGQESVTAAESLLGTVEQEEKEQQAEGSKSAEELGVEVRHPSDGAE